MLEADPNLQRTVTIHEGIENMFAQCHKLYDNKTVSNVHTVQDKFFFNKEIKRQFSIFIMF
jgi:hypothetical protein